MASRRIDKRIRNYQIGPSGEKTVPMNAEVMEVFERQRAAFRAKFGRDPGPQDPIFFDPDKDTPQFISESVEDTMIEIMGESGLPPQFIYAFKKTGRIVTERNTQFPD